VIRILAIVKSVDETAETGLRERKKARTRQLIAQVAARLFAEHGYEQVAVSDVAREAEVSEQTVYNYFQTKEQLVIDRDELVQDRLVELIRARPCGVNSADAIRDFVIANVDAIPTIAPELWRGEIGYLATISPAVHRLTLEMADRQANAVATAIADTTPVSAEVARLQAIAIAGVFQLLIGEAGRLTAAGRSQKEIAKRLRPVVVNVLDELARWFSLSEPDTGRSGVGGAGSRLRATAAPDHPRPER
jgi:AcrR family transcriptional regulator